MRFSYRLLLAVSLSSLLFACQDPPPPVPIDSSSMAPVAARGAPPPPPYPAVVEDEPGTVEPGNEGDEPALPIAVRPVREIGASGVVREVDRELSAMRSTTYAHHSHVDETRGDFTYDCSGFVGYALGVSAPEALAELRQGTVPRPLAKHFVSFFGTLPPGAGRGHWASVGRVVDLQPGDIIAWIRPPEVVSKNSGHVVFVHGPVTPYEGRSDAFVVPIADSTHAPHGKSDPRYAPHASGLGTGNIVLLADGAGRPVGYKWSTWRKSIEYHTPTAVGRVVR